VDTHARILIAGHTGLLGSSLLARLESLGYDRLLTPGHDELDLTDSAAVDAFFAAERPEFVFLAAGMTGGIVANMTYPADLLHVNIAIQDAVFEAAVRRHVGRVVTYASSCVYPREAAQPIREDSLFSGPIEMTSAAYAAAKTALIIACRAYNAQHGAGRFICLLPNSMFGPNDNFDPRTGHVLSGMLMKFHVAKLARDGGEDVSVTLWGSGEPRREFVFVDDVADASIFALDHAHEMGDRHYNVGSGKDMTIRELAERIAAVVGYDGAVEWDAGKPDGTMRKLLDSADFRALGWAPSTSFDEGLRRTYEWLAAYGPGAKGAWDDVPLR